MIEVSSVERHSHCYEVNMVVLDNSYGKAGLKPLVFAVGLKAMLSAPPKHAFKVQQHTLSTAVPCCVITSA